MYKDIDKSTSPLVLIFYGNLSSQVVKFLNCGKIISNTENICEKLYHLIQSRLYGIILIDLGLFYDEMTDNILKILHPLYCKVLLIHLGTNDIIDHAITLAHYIKSNCDNDSKNFEKHLMSVLYKLYKSNNVSTHLPIIKKQEQEAFL